MYVKKVKRKCMVRGCKNTECFAVSLRREAGNSVIACKNCLKEAMQAILNMPAAEPTKQESMPPPPLFFNEKSERTAEILHTADETKYNCPYCGKEYKTEKGLTAHISVCDAKTE